MNSFNFLFKFIISISHFMWNKKHINMQTFPAVLQKSFNTEHI